MAQASAKPSNDLVREELESILQHPTFANSPRLRRLLTYVTERSLAADVGSLKEYAIGVEVFDRGPEFDPSADSVVRASMRRLRSYLETYYSSPGVQPGVLIEIPKGHYVARFRAATEAMAAKVGDMEANRPTLSSGVAATSELGTKQIALLTSLLVFGVVLLLWMALPTVRDSATASLSVSVVPLSVVGDDDVGHRYAASLTAELTGLLAHYPELKVLRRSGVQERGTTVASYALGGTVSSIERQLRIRVTLTRVIDDETIWSMAFNDAAAPTQLASTIGRYLRLELVKDYQYQKVRRRTRSEEVARLIQAAQADFYAVQQGGNTDPYQQLNSARRAVALDPNIPEGYFFVAMSLNLLHAFGIASVEDVSEEAEAALERGLELAPTDPLLLWARGEALAQYHLDYSEAERSFRQAIGIAPLHLNSRLFHESIAMLMLRQGRVGEALQHYRRALRVYDADAHVYEGYAYTLFVDGQHREAIQAADQGLKLLASGGWLDSLTSIKVRSFLALGETAKANDMLDDAVRDGADVRIRPMIIPALAALGKTREVRQLLAQLAAERNPYPYILALGYAMTRDVTRSFEWIRRGIADRNPSTMMFVRIEPAFAEIRGDDRWAEVLRQLERDERIGAADADSPSALHTR